jgi:hypothetical protein
MRKISEKGGGKTWNGLRARAATRIIKCLKIVNNKRE